MRPSSIKGVEVQRVVHCRQRRAIKPTSQRAIRGCALLSEWSPDPDPARWARGMTNDPQITSKVESNSEFLDNATGMFDFVDPSRACRT